MNDIVLVAILCICGSLIVYHHVGYPLLLKWYARQHPIQAKEHQPRCYKKSRADRAYPSITILVPAYNEQQWIAEKLRNLAALDYPRKRLKVLVICDGCTDDTVAIAQQTIQEAICADRHFEIRDYSTNRGKVAVINEQMLTIKSDITAMTDVSALLAIDALLIAAKHFQNPRTGVLNSRYQLLNQQNIGEAQYWQFQNALQADEACFGASIGAHGALYFFRTHLFTPLSDNTINDDFVIPMDIVRQGYIAEYDKNLVAIELEPTNSSNDFKRRLRISAGNMQQAIQLSDLFLPRYKQVAFAFLSGKGLRLATPYLMILCLITNILLSHYWFFTATLLLQLAVYAIGIFSYLFPSIFHHKLCQMMMYLITGHYANLVGGLRYLLGLENGKWQRIQR
ncbi:glycosyltransferase family 2 protein [Vibrio sinensis]|uniref:Glycosyltransferase family 2 protein n=1 Tax=Vibrio sinensis TaxID=2302434 RepID=A0A3A6QKS6_9VIBR|nr:glycosyltransferase family 2 protein [Vibrio sinensis]RJX66494.1 glycosyltransferase family 2 protein [Vibrio sinensis]